MSFFDGLRDAATSERGTFMAPGIYDVRVSRMMCKETQSSGLAVITELDILTSKPRPQEDPRGEGRTWNPTPAGIQGTWFQSMTDKNVAFPAIKGFLYAVLGMRSNDSRVERLDEFIPGSENWPTNPTRKPVALIGNLMEHAVSENNLLAGSCVHLECSMILTQKRKEDFTLYRFTPADYAALGLPPLNLDVILAKAMTPIGMVTPVPVVGWSPPPLPVSPPVWGAPPAIAGPAGAAGVMSPPPWIESGTPRNVPAWTLPQGGQMSPDGRKYWAPGMSGWAPVPQDDIPF